MHLVNLMDKEFVRLGENVGSVEDAISLMTGLFIQERKYRLSKDNVIKAVLDREALGGTVYPSGLAVPHARIPGFGDLIIGVCTPEKPFMKNDIEVRCVVIIITSLEVSNTYVQTLAALIRISADKTRFTSLCAAEDPDNFFDIINDVQIKNEITVEDIMTEDVLSISADATLAALADLFYMKNLSYLPVVDSEGNMIGEVSSADLLKVGIPGYAMMMENLGFLKTMEPFEELLRKEEEWQVERIMRKPVVILSPDSSIVEAAQEMTQHHRSHLPVMDGKNLVGIVHINDFIKKVIRG